MSIHHITAKDLRKNPKLSGIVLQGCGGDPQEWLDGINDMLTKNGILLNGTQFKECSVFDNHGSTCILYPFDENVQLSIGRLAIWRLQTWETFGGTWLSDFVPNQLGGYLTDPEISEAPCQTM